jgi:uncharacterized protein YcbK (DUF882 family)
VGFERLARLLLAALLAVAVLLPPTAGVVNAEVGDRTLYLYHTHTHETARITFKRNGVYDKQGLEQLDWFLRDWRNNQPTTMAPQLFDLIWEVYQKVGASQPINVVSSYRSPKTNALLRARSSGVASNSQHMLGHAMDFFIPGVPLTRLRQVAMQQQVGGVGFYPHSGSPFVHLDVGTVRAWPRMTEAQLRQTFPSGKTLHLASNGKVLSAAGRAYAQAQWNQCHAVPCTNAAAIKGGALALGRTTMVAAATTSATGKTFADIHHGKDPGNRSIRDPGSYDQANADEVDDEADTAGPAQTAVTTVAVAAPVPLDRPAGLEPVMRTASLDTATMKAAAAVPFDSLFPAAYSPQNPPPAPADAAPVPLAATAATADAGDVPLPAHKSYEMMVATGEFARHRAPATAVAAIDTLEGRSVVPAARSGTTTTLAYAASPGTSAESQLQALIENETTGALAATAGAGTSLTNTVGTPLGADALKSYAADRRLAQGASPAAPRTLASFTARPAALVAPGFNASLVRPVAMSSGAFARFHVPEATDLDPATELGPMVGRLGFHPDHSTPLSVGRFAPARPLVVASR